MLPTVPGTFKQQVTLTGTTASALSSKQWQGTFKHQVTFTGTTESAQNSAKEPAANDSILFFLQVLLVVPKCNTTSLQNGTFQQCQRTSE